MGVSGDAETAQDAPHRRYAEAESQSGTRLHDTEADGADRTGIQNQEAVHDGPRGTAFQADESDGREPRGIPTGGILQGVACAQRQTGVHRRNNRHRQQEAPQAEASERHRGDSTHDERQSAAEIQRRHKGILPQEVTTRR